jgi:hypothetical protein
VTIEKRAVVVSELFFRSGIIALVGEWRHLLASGRSEDAMWSGEMWMRLYYIT